MILNMIGVISFYLEKASAEINLSLLIKIWLREGFVIFRDVKFSKISFFRSRKLAISPDLSYNSFLFPPTLVNSPLFVTYTDSNMISVFISKAKGEELSSLLSNGSSRVMAQLTVGPHSTFRYANINRTSVLFVSVSFIILMIISLAWLIFYYIQRFRYIQAKDILAVSIPHYLWSRSIPDSFFCALMRDQVLCLQESIIVYDFDTVLHPFNDCNLRTWLIIFVCFVQTTSNLSHSF